MTFAASAQIEVQNKVRLDHGDRRFKLKEQWASLNESMNDISFPRLNRQERWVLLTLALSHKEDKSNVNKTPTLLLFALWGIISRSLNILHASISKKIKSAGLTFVWNLLIYWPVTYGPVNEKTEAAVGSFSLSLIEYQKWSQLWKTLIGIFIRYLMLIL